MSGLTVTGKLPIGVKVDGETYKAFSLRPATLRDSCAAADYLRADVSEAYFENLARSAVFDGLSQEQIAGMIVGMYRRTRAEADGGASANELRYATIAQQITFDGLPQEKVTLDLLMGLFDRDAMAVERKLAELEKKLDELSSS